MQKVAGKLIFSPTDLTTFQESPFASWMDRYVIEFPEKASQKDPVDPLLKKLAEKGYKHEDLTEQSFVDEGLSVHSMTRDSTVSDTLLAMQTGYDVIAQAKLEKESFAGFSDFLIKVPGKSDLGEYHYEVWDTKLSKSLKPSYPIQLCCYAEMVCELQGILPEKLTLVLGDGKRAPLFTKEHFAFYKDLKSRFLRFQSEFTPELEPDPADSKSWGSWSRYAEKILLEQDHLFQVATITRAQIKKLNAARIHTLTELANTTISHVKGISPEVFQRLVHQAAIQLQSRGNLIPDYRLIPHDNSLRRGLTLLPPHSDSDVFFDIEGYPLVSGGLEYLWGVTYFDDDGARQFRDFWAHDAEQEKQAFIEFIGWVYKRWQNDPTMHIYHYAQYEITACRKLMGRYGVCEYEVDELLRNEVFIDLYKIVKGAILIGKPRYSIKNVEHLYREKRQTEVGNGGESVVVYDEWRNAYLAGHESGKWQESEVLTEIRKYNIDDCNSTQELVEWLRNLQVEHHISFIPPVKPEPNKDEPSEDNIDELRESLLNKACILQEQNPEEAIFFENLAWWLEFHRREDKPVHWRHFDRLGQPDELLGDDADCISNCSRTSEPPFKPTSRSRSLAYRYQFDPEQPLKKLAEQYFIQGLCDEKGFAQRIKTVVDESEPGEGLITLQTTLDELPENINLIPDERVPNKIIQQSLRKVIQDIAEEKTASHQAIISFLRRQRPKFEPAIDGAIVKSQSPEDRLQEVIKAVSLLSNSYLPIQGPPGTGKSYTGARIIGYLIQQGARVGICSNSHKAILNLLKGTASYCIQQGISANFACSKAEGEETLLEQLGIVVQTNSKLADEIEDACVIGTTAWGFSRDDFANRFDYLFIDEAGQVSVANLIAISRSSRNLILMGDQMQLGQPTQASHPAESGLSILDYLLHKTPTIPDDRGVFLGTTFRMHPEVNRFISEHIYDGKLQPATETAKRQILVPDDYQGPLNKPAGIVFIPVNHQGNSQSSEEEVLQIVHLRNELIGRTLLNTDGSQRKVTHSDILYVAPYNHQVSLLRKALGDEAKVGSVDKFQGQEAPIVIISMCSSQADDSPRGMDFIFDKNRLNVAVSRAQSLAVIVANPNLTQASISHVEQVSKVNLMAALMQE